MTVKELRKMLEECNDDAEVGVLLGYSAQLRQIIALDWQPEKNRVAIFTKPA